MQEYIQKYNEPDLAGIFKEFIGDKEFPCVGAKSALAHKQINFCMAGDITTPESDAHITKQLQSFAASCTPESLFVSFIVIFEQDSGLNELQFEHYLWQRLQALHELDAQEFEWDSQVSSDPNSPHFSMSIGGKAFYIVGLHPGASRPARRFSRPALVFNLHSQFELLRDKGSYARIRETILERDLKINGSLNPMLAVHGQSSEAMQYSGREISEAWKCPFHAKHKTGNV